MSLCSQGESAAAAAAATVEEAATEEVSARGTAIAVTMSFLLQN